MGHTSTVVRRPLHLTSPIMEGADVAALQAKVKQGLEHYKVDWLPLAVDGKLGKQTLHAARFYAWIIGLGEGHRNPIRKGTIAEATQRLLRNPKERTRLDRIRENRRQGRLQKIRKTQSEGPKATCEYARSFVGTTENPADSNSGPTHLNSKGQPGGVTFWENYWGLGSCFWCLCFACYCVKAIGRGRIEGICVNAAEIERSARAHTNGWVTVPASEAREGDISLWCFDGSGVPDHGELVVGPFMGHSNDVGGNTSDGAGGSQSNGGGVFQRPDRDLALLTCVARPLY